MNPVKRLASSARAALGWNGRPFRRIGAPSPGQTDAFEVQRRLMAKLARTEPTIFDVGANKGQTTKRYRALFPDSEIYSFEPFPQCVAELQAMFSGDHRVHIVPKAVARQKGVATFYVNHFDATNSLLPRPADARRYYPRSAGYKESIEVDVTSLDAFVEAADVPAVDILKFDIQGGELEALRGAERVLRSGATALIYTEMMFIPHYEGAPLFHEIWSFLRKFGYSLFDIYDLHRARNGQLRYGDALFVSESVRRSVIDQSPEEP